MHFILICFINTTRFQIANNISDVSRHSSERFNRLLTISYGKYCFTFGKNQLPIQFLERITFAIRGLTVMLWSVNLFMAKCNKCLHVEKT